MVKIDMRKQIMEVIDNVSKIIDGIVISPAGRNLFETGDYQIMIISKEHKEEFHSVTAKLIFIKKRARPNIETTVGFFSTRVTKNTKRDW